MESKDKVLQGILEPELEADRAHQPRPKLGANSGTTADTRMRSTANADQFGVGHRERANGYRSWNHEQFNDNLNDYARASRASSLHIKRLSGPFALLFGFFAVLFSLAILATVFVVAFIRRNLWLVLMIMLAIWTYRAHM